MYKQTIVIRQDLKLSKGKLAAQAAHASLEAYKKASPKLRQAWESQGSKKVVLKVKTLRTLKSLHRKALGLRLPCSLIRDAGLTELRPGTVTCLGIGPDREERIDRVTGKTKML
jgi:PTH2 family peptidyl-tRNA hydrolase